VLYHHGFPLGCRRTSSSRPDIARGSRTQRSCLVQACPGKVKFSSRRQNCLHDGIIVDIIDVVRESYKIIPIVERLGYIRPFLTGIRHGRDSGVMEYLDNIGPGRSSISVRNLRRSEETPYFDSVLMGLLWGRREKGTLLRPSGIEA